MLRISRSLFITLSAILALPLSMSAQLEGKVVLKNVSSGLYWGAGNNQGTRASLLPYSEYQTLHRANGSSNYTMESQVSHGGNNYYFNGDYMDGQPTTLTISRLSNGYYTIASGSNYYGYSSQSGTYSGSKILGKNLYGGSNGSLWQIIHQSDFNTYLQTATMDEPVDATFLILNPNFGNNNRNNTAWTMQASSYNLCGGNDDNKCAESWCSSFNLQQTLNKVLSSVPNGIYTLTAQAALTDYANKYDGDEYPVIFANDETTPFCNMAGSDIASDMSTLSAAFSSGKYQVQPIIFEVTNRRITIGARGTRFDTWCIWDNFRLYYYGPNVHTGIKDTSTLPMTDGSFYNLQGQRVKPTGKGLYIVNGKKRVIR